MCNSSLRLPETEGLRTRKASGLSPSLKAKRLKTQEEPMIQSRSKDQKDQCLTICQVRGVSSYSAFCSIHVFSWLFRSSRCLTVSQSESLRPSQISHGLVHGAGCASDHLYCQKYWRGFQSPLRTSNFLDFSNTFFFSCLLNLVSLLQAICSFK